MKPCPWSTADEALAAGLGTASDRAIATRLRVSRWLVRHWRERLGISPADDRRRQKLESQITALLATHTCREMAAALGMTEWAMRSKVYRMGLAFTKHDQRGPRRKHSVDEVVKAVMETPTLQRAARRLGISRGALCARIKREGLVESGRVKYAERDRWLSIRSPVP